MSSPGPADRKKVRVYDLRSEKKQPTSACLDITNMVFDRFLTVVSETFGIEDFESFALVTTDRVGLDEDNFGAVKDGSTVYLLKDINQDLPASTEEIITYTPHFHTLIKAGTYEYHTSAGNNSLPSALAELIDNSLSATAKNDGMRKIEIQMMFNETGGKPAVIVLDNGCGMTSNKLNNWAVYKLSKFLRGNSEFASQQEPYRRPDPVRRSLNSDLSYFGVGGKQSIFYIGNSVRMITKQADSPDVHELIMSEEDFEKKEKEKVDVFSGIIKNRKPKDSSHVTSKDEQFLHNLIAKEHGKESFTAVVITGLKPDNVTFMKNEFEVLARQLAHIFHYYIHGADGNCHSSPSTNPQELSKIQMEISLNEKQGPPKMINLRAVNDDMQSLYIENAAVDKFEFTATVPGDGRVEGLVRYHPFLYDRETYPQGPAAEDAPAAEDNDIDNEPALLHCARGKKPIFECFWNGRLIPCTTISEFAWCSSSSKLSRSTKVTAECYDRLSGVLFTDDFFKVTQNKLTFIDLELRLKNKETIFKVVTNGQERRGNIEKEFTVWLQNCHEKFDKQVKFIGFKGTEMRTDATKKKQSPWAVYSSIDWGGRTFKEGWLVKSQKTKPILNGTVIRFLLQGEHSGDVFATGGVVEINREPQGLYDTLKIISIRQINKNATLEEIQKSIDSDTAKLPVELQVEWPKGNTLSEDVACPAGGPIGPIQVQIKNSLGHSLSSMPAGHGSPRFNILLRIIHHGQKGDSQHVASLAKQPVNSVFWFKPYRKLTKPGQYSLLLNAVINESEANFGGRDLPRCTVKFTMKSGDATKFVLDKIGPGFRVGVPFDIPLFIRDAYDNPATASDQLQPSLTCSELELSYKAVESDGDRLSIRGVRAIGKIQNKPTVMVTIPGLEEDTQNINLNLRPGLAHCLHVTPEENPLTVENGKMLMFDVEIRDEGGNITANPRQKVQCKIPGVETVSTDCSRTGAGKLLISKINQKIVNGEPQILRAQFEMHDQKHVLPVTRELKVVPSQRISTIEVLSGDEDLVLKNNDKIEWPAGGCLENLSYKLKDEADREVALTPEIARKVKVSWTEEAELDDLVSGKLPDIHVTTQASTPQYCLVSYLGSGVSVSFTIVPNPGDPTQLKATVVNSAVKLGETLEGNIKLELLDTYNNTTKMLIPSRGNQMTVEAEGLDKSSLKFDWEEVSGSVAVSGVRFRGGVPGPRNIVFRYGDYEERVMVEVTAGVPAELQMVSAPPQPLQFLNDKGNSTPFVIRLCDRWGNPSPEERVEFEVKSNSPHLQVTTSVSSQPIGADGEVSIMLTRVCGPKGYYSLTFQGSFDNKPIPGPSVNLTLIADPNKPVSLSVQGEFSTMFPAGGLFPVFSVTVVSDEGRPLGNINPTALSMLLWKDDAPQEKNAEFRCSRPLDNDRKDCFYFRDKEIPKIIGKYIIQFLLRINETEALQSDVNPINVVSNNPEKLEPVSPILNPVVFHSENVDHRTLVENLTLNITDSYGNLAGANLVGRVIVTVRSPDGETKKVLPLFEEGKKQVQFYFVDGKAHIKRLAVMRNSPYENGAKYILVFTPEVLMGSVSLIPFELPFHFYTETQQNLTELSRKKAELTGAIDRYKEMFIQANEFLKLLTNLSRTSNQKEAELRRELDRRRVTPGRTLPLQAIDTLIREREVNAERIQRSRRSCTVNDPFRGQQGVYGRVCHLAQVDDDAAARVISWHISGSMKCVVTRTTDVARAIYNDTNGDQQVMPLDSIYVHPTNRPLPHVQNGRPLFDPPGNPIFARDLLFFPQHREICEVVFKNLLGGTIVMDDVDSASQYRKKVVERRIPCPDILTRDGEKVNSRGIFGGAKNRAPPIDRMEVVFGAPLPVQYHALKEEIDLLVQYRSVVLKKEEADKELNDHLNAINSPEYREKKQKMLDKQKQREEIDKQLESMQERLSRRRLPEAATSFGSTAKRPRM